MRRRGPVHLGDTFPTERFSESLPMPIVPLRQRVAAPRRRALRPQSTLGALILGVLSLGLVLPSATATLSGLSGRGVTGWTAPYTVFTTQVHPYTKLAAKYLYGPLPGLSVACVLHLPTLGCDGLSLLGAGLGACGVYLGWRERRIAGLALAGLIVGLSVPCIAAAYAVGCDWYYD